MSGKTARFFLSCLLFAAFLTASGCSRKKEASEAFFAMNTYMTFTVYGENSVMALDSARDKIEELEGLWSVTKESSDIYTLNHSEGSFVSVNPLTAELIDFSLDMARLTEGALDPTIYPVLTAWGFTADENRIPKSEEISVLLDKVDYENVILKGNEAALPQGMMLDMGAVAKGYAGDILVKQLREQGIGSALLDIGGNIQAVGSRPDGNNWCIGLRNPFTDGIIGTLGISDLAVVTSGNYERSFIGEDGKIYGHIIDPENGYPVDNGLMSVTIIGRGGAYCDALSTALFVMGLDRAAEYHKTHSDFEMIIITEDGTIHLTEGAQKLFIADGKYEIKVIN